MRIDGKIRLKKNPLINIISRTIMITISESAKTKIKDLLSEEGNPKLSLRTFVQGGGCSGFSYGFTFDEEMNEDDFQFNCMCNIG